MQRIHEAMNSASIVGHAIKIGLNKARVRQGLAPLARDHLPFNRRERPLEAPVISDVVTYAKRSGLTDGRAYHLKGYLWQIGRTPDPTQSEDFVLTFNRATDAAVDIVHDQCNSPYVVLAILAEITRSLARNSGRSTMTREDLAARCRLHPDQISRHTTQLERTDPPLLRKINESRGVIYELLPPPGTGFASWRGDRASRLDAQTSGPSAQGDLLQPPA